MKKSKRKTFSLLTISTFLHIFALFCSFYRDKIYVGIKWSAEYYKEPNYWIWFFSWWCAQTSLVTIIYFIYKLFKKISQENYFDKVFSLIVINANIISVSIFTISAIFGLTPVARSDGPLNIFSWEVSSKAFWWFYAIIWHYLAPLLTINYFAQRENNFPDTYLGRRRLFLYSFIHPVLWFIFVFLRPLIPGSESYFFSKETPLYPYFFFEWVRFNNFEQVFQVSVIIIFWLFLFWFSTLSFWNYAKCKLEDGNYLFLRKKKKKKTFNT